MGIRRRRKKLTTIISSVDRRLRSVEYRHVPTKIAPKSITTTEITDGTIPSSDPKDNGATGSVSSTTAPVEFAVITAATYSPRNVTGTVDRVDITTATDHGLSKDQKVTIYGLNNSDVNLDGTYVITEVPSTTTLRFSRGLTGYYPSAINLAVQATVTSRFCSTTTATLTLSNADHGFVIGDVITVAGIPTDDFFNGTFKVSAVNGANISYNFIGPQASVSITSSTGSVKAVLHKYAIIGDTWIDTSVTPNAYKIWDGLSWQSGTSLPDGVIIDDGLAPAAPDGLQATTNGYYNPSTGNASIAVTLTWTAPTTNSDGSTLTDLAGYRVFYRYTHSANPEDGSEAGDPSTQWISAGDTSETTLSMRDFNIASTIDFAVQAYDSSGKNYSAYSTPLSVETGTPAIVLNSPSKPSLESRLGTLTVTWDGYDSTGSVPPPTLSYVQVHVGTSSSFSPSNSTLKGQLGTDGVNSLIVTGLTYGTTYYAKLIFVSTTGSSTAASLASSGVSLASLVDADVIGKVLSGAKIINGSITASDAIIGNTITGNLIQANTIEAVSIKANSLTADQIQAGSIDAASLSATAIDGKTITGATIRTGTTGGRIVLTSSALTAYASNGTTETFKIDSATGTVTISGYATSSDLSGKISTGSAASDINAYSTTISGTKITSGTIDGNRLTATTQIILSDGGAYNAKIGYQTASQGTTQYTDVTYGLYSGSTILAWFGLWGGGAAELGTNFTENYIDMFADNTMNIYSTGSGGVNIGGNLSVNGTRLYVYGRHVIYDSNDTAAMLVYNGYGGSEVFRINTNSTYLNGVGIYVSGTVRYSGTIGTYSSERYKLNISDYATNYSVLDIPLITYQYDYSKLDSTRSDIGEPTFGSIAERVEELGLKDLVIYDTENRPDGINYSMIGLMLIPIVKELREEIAELKKKVGQ